MSKLAAIGAVASGVVVAVGAASPTEAYSCEEQTYSYHSRFNGYGAFNSTDPSGDLWLGIQGWIENGPMSVCGTAPDPDSNFVTTWVMIASSGGLNAKYAQAGFFRYQGDCTYWYAEFAHIGDSGFSRVLDTDAGCRTGNGLTFKVYRSGGREQMYAADTWLFSTAYDPVPNWPGKFVSQVSAESKYPTSNVVGTADNPATIKGLLLQKGNQNVAEFG